MSKSEDTIVALSTPSVKSALAIVRVSGSLSKTILRKISGITPKERVATYRAFTDCNGNVFDHGIALYFKGPNSFTGEDQAEFHVHGGLGVIEILTDSCLLCSSERNLVRFAEAGEFSKRAYLNGKINLLEAEAIADLINASSKQVVKAISNITKGKFGKEITNLAEEILLIRTNIEAQIDFSDEDIGEFFYQEYEKNIAKNINYLEYIFSIAKNGENLAEFFKLVVLGPPNVGKSSLVNKLSKKNISIVNSLAGTTRDVISSNFNLGRVTIEIYDTAGIRNTEDIIEKEGIERAISKSKISDLILYVVDDSLDNKEIYNLHIKKIKKLEKSKDVFVLINKSDLSKTDIIFKNLKSQVKKTFHISVKHNLKINELEKNIEKVLFEKLELLNETEAIFLRKRTTDNLLSCKNHLKNSLINLKGNNFDLLSEDLRLAHMTLFEITGKTSSEDILDRVFSTFCIGK